VLPCDVTDEASVDAVFEALAQGVGLARFPGPRVAFSDKQELDGRYVDTSEDNFVQSLLISCYSFTALAKKAER
jgi:enoyl-[acyl-carrier protein] reductase I